MYTQTVCYLSRKLIKVTFAIYGPKYKEEHKFISYIFRFISIDSWKPIYRATDKALTADYFLSA